MSKLSPEAKLLLRCAAKVFKKRGDLERLKEVRATLNYANKKTS